MIPNNYKSPISVCWDITSNCNENCAFCYKVTSSSCLSLNENLKILENLIQAGIKKISWVGGEPLLYQGLFELIARAHSAGIITSITTNGMLINKEVLKSLNKVLNWVSFPLDGSNPEIQNKISRRKSHFDNIIYLLKMIDQMKFSFNLKINTIATKLNKYDIPNLIDIIRNYNIRRWKLFQFFPIRGRAKENRQIFEISDYKFDQLKKIIVSKAHLISNCIIHFTDKYDLQKSYFSICPDGTVRISSYKEDIYVGNLRENNVSELWKTNSFDYIRHLERNNWIKRREKLSDRSFMIFCQ